MMDISITFATKDIVLAGYIFCMLCVNFIMYLIAAFYRRKFGHTSPKAGFSLAIVLGLLFIISLFVRAGSAQVQNIAQSLLLLLSAIASGCNSISVYVTMKRVSK
jgi:hypothetical protein